MALSSLIFYFLSTILCGSALAVVISRNAVHSVLFLILAFFNAAGLFLMLGAEFLAMILVIVYVGAVAVLFLFVVMMLDISSLMKRHNLKTYLPISLLVGGILLAELVMLYVGWSPADIRPDASATAISEKITNTHALGQLIYTNYIAVFQLSGVILLVAMIGAITLCLRHRDGVRKQNIQSQLSRNPKDIIRMVNKPIQDNSPTNTPS